MSMSGQKMGGPEMGVVTGDWLSAELRKAFQMANGKEQWHK